ncbi:MAG: DNA mismatch repair protein MutS [Clostridium sp.]|nr:DNA mismatch repair protein MutS [Clostridium sp.]
MSLTPMMQQYFEIKERYKDSILFYRLGDFYEMFFDDAEIVAKELELVLTGRACGLDEKAPMCGVPYHAANKYIGKLILKGYKVAIAEQIEDPSQAKGIVKRDVVKVVTPGTLLDEDFIENEKNNFIMGVFKTKGSIGLSFCDISTGEFKGTYIKDDLDLLKNEISKFYPKEAVITDEGLKSFLEENFDILVNLRDEKEYLHGKNLNSYFKSFSGGYNNIIASASGILISYLEETQKTALTNLTHLEIFKTEDSMALDINTKRNLELTENIVDKKKKGSLLWVIDKTATAMGGRNLRRWIESPLISKDMIDRRLDAVDAFYNNLDVLGEIEEALKSVYDIERIVSKVALKSVNPKEMISLKKSLEKIPEIKKVLSKIDYGEVSRLNEKLEPLDDVFSLLDSALIEDAPMVLRDGGIIKSTYDAEIGELRDITINGKNYIAKMQETEREKTGIKSLKIGYNKVFGYYIDVSKTNIKYVPEDGRYIRKQTLANSERYITEDLKIIEDKILNASDKLIILEQKVFADVRTLVENEVHRLKKVSRIIADLDSYHSLSRVAHDNNYVKPVINENDKFSVVEGRHPVVEKMLDYGEFVSNDINMDSEANRFLIITGPNMSGKSTFMRQNALIALLAQIGSFVPCKSANISVSDRIFTRIGASDDLAGGKSTFMVEMSEVSNILTYATDKSLIILDEVGRGTSTFDGLSIAWAVSEYIINDLKGSKTLFATHYHELTDLGEIEGVKNYSVLVKEVGSSIAFLRKIVPGGADESYGIEVAKIAGLPRNLIKRANEILYSLEKDKKSDSIKPRKDADALREEKQTMQLGFFDIEKDNLVKELKELDVLNITPLKAMEILYELNEKAREVD